MSDTTPTHPRDLTTTHVVAVVLRHRSRIALFRRSAQVHHDAGRWHCITGYIEQSTSARTQAVAEVTEETGLRIDSSALLSGSVITLLDASGGIWCVHTYALDVMDPRLKLNWEHDDYRWASSRTLPGYTTVSWLPDVLAAVATAGSRTAANSRGTTENAGAIS